VSISKKIIQIGGFMLGITKQDFMIYSSNFDIRTPWNLLRITAGAFLLPHAFGKFIGGVLNPAVVGFFEKAGFQPPETWVLLAFLIEVSCGVALVLGLLTRFAALGACMTLLVAAGALHLVKGFGWYWNLGGYEYPIFWAIVCLVISMQAFQVKDKG
jgi:putative oxidoreductase